MNVWMIRWVIPQLISGALFVVIPFLSCFDAYFSPGGESTVLGITGIDVLLGDGAFDFTPLFFAPAVSIIGGIVVIVTCLLTLGIDISQNRSAFAIFLLADMILFPLMAFMMRFSTGMYMSDSGMGVVGTYDGIPQMIQSLVPADVTSVSIATGVGYRLTWVAAIIMLVDLPEIWSWVHGRRCRRIGTSTDSVSLNIIRDS